MLIELQHSVADLSEVADREDIRALADLCRFVARECRRLNLEAAESSALSLAAELSRRLLQHCH